jgi:hypothetical protein
MKKSSVQLPDLQTLTTYINAVIYKDASSSDRLIITGREKNVYTSTFPSEILTCQLADGSQFQLLCKYAIGQDHNRFGHRGGVPYEAEIYRQVLQQIPISTPKFYGTYENPEVDEILLIIEFFKDTLSIKHAGYHKAIQSAASWLGEFHRITQTLVLETPLEFLNRHEATYYLGWAERTLSYTRPLHKQYPWLEYICGCFEEIVPVLLGSTNVIIHGEFYPNNILYPHGDIYPIDWESAAVAKGEIDLASLTENWPPAYIHEARTAYLSTRWPDGPSDDFESRLEAAYLYWHFRWLGDRPEWTLGDRERWRFGHLKSIGEKMGLI